MKKIILMILILALIFSFGCSKGRVKSSIMVGDNEKLNYVILDQKETLNGDVYADILVKSYSPADTPVEIRKEVAIKIAEKGGFDQMCLYSTEEAQKANFSTTYARENPGALEEGFLGRYMKGEFTDKRFFPPKPR